MKYTVTITHNPQDYFEDKEDDTLNKTFYIYNKYDLENIDRMFDAVDNGYNAIIFQTDGDRHV